MNKKTAIIVGVIILVLTSIVTPFLIRKLNKKVEVQPQEQNEVQEQVKEKVQEQIIEVEENASGEQTEENQTESEVEEDEKIEEQPKTNESKVQSTKLKSSLQSSTANATSNEKQPAKKEENAISQVQDIEEVIYETNNEPIVENAVVIDVANVTEQVAEQPQVTEQMPEVAEVPVVPETQNIVLPDGAVGILKIDKMGINQKVADGHSLEVLKNDLGHVDSTAYSTGNVGILGHNSGSAGYFQNLWDLKQDDVIEYTTTDGTRTYKVSEVVQIADDDWSKLANTKDNRITLITCVKGVPEKRWCIQAVEI